MARVGLRKKMSGDLLLLDGAMGTELLARRADAGGCNERLNIESRDTVLAVHRAYLEAGSDAVLTNTFGANRFLLGRHGLAGQVGRLNAAGAEVAREAAGEERYVLGDIGPSGDFLQPVGTLDAGELEEAFCEQAAALVGGAVDGLIIETMTALEEMAIAVRAVKSVCGDLPVLASMSFEKRGDDFRTMMGVSVEAAVSKLVSLGVDAVGFNCGTASLDEYVELAEQLVETARAASAEVPILAEPNAGRPELADGRAVYRVSPGDFAAAAEKMCSAGVSIIGGCCGTGPAHIEALAGALAR